MTCNVNPVGETLYEKNLIGKPLGGIYFNINNLWRS